MKQVGSRRDQRAVSSNGNTMSAAEPSTRNESWQE